MSARGRFTVAAAVLAVCLAVCAVYVLLFTTAANWAAGGLALAGAFAFAAAVAPLLGGGQVRRREDEAELEPLPHPERYRIQGTGRAPWGPGGLRGPGIVDPASRWHHPEDYR